MRTAAGLALVIAHCSWRWQAAAAVAAAETASAGSAASGVVMCAGSGNTTACPPKTATCCHHNFSKTTMGCCPYPNAVCCAGSYGLCCPAGTTCKSTGTYSGLCLKIKHGIGDPPPGLMTNGAPQVCTPGALTPPSTTLPSVIIIGDSVSIGYTPHVSSRLQGKVQVQHSPAASGGGADDTPYGKQCIVTLESFIRSASYEPIKFDLIVFNFGLHDMSTSDAAHSLANYTAQLGDIADKLLSTGSKVLYALTTPFMPGNGPLGVAVVPTLNAIALNVTRARGIPAVDLYSRVTDKCGKSYKTCAICAKTPCAYHYTADGYEWIATTLSAAILAHL